MRLEVNFSGGGFFFFFRNTFFNFFFFFFSPSDDASCDVDAWRAGIDRALQPLAVFPRSMVLALVDAIVACDPAAIADAAWLETAWAAAGSAAQQPIRARFGLAAQGANDGAETAHIDRRELALRAALARVDGMTKEPPVEVARRRWLRARRARAWRGLFFFFFFFF
jgi:hypothetical protein